jgi:hypothetical protein
MGGFFVFQHKAAFNLDQGRLLYCRFQATHVCQQWPVDARSFTNPFALAVACNGWLSPLTSNTPHPT